MTNTLSNDTRDLKIDELDSVSGGVIKGALAGVCSRYDEGASGGQNDPAQMFQQILQQLGQGQG